ncbi:MAG: hypothetical protein ABJF50_09750 [Paracoccaceae bacterium]
MFQCLTLVLFGCLSVALFFVVYVVAGTDDQTWAYDALNLGSVAARLICVLAVVLAFLNRVRGQVVLALGLLAFSFVAPVLGSLDCLAGGLGGGYDRHTNCGLDTVLPIGVMAYMFVVLTHGKLGLVLILMSCVIIPSGIVAARWQLAHPLEKIVAEADLAEDCYLRRKKVAYTFNAADVTRLKTAEDLQLGWIIGEQAPRIYRVESDKVFVWRYTQRAFEPVAKREASKLKLTPKGELPACHWTILGSSGKAKQRRMFKL